MTGRVIAGTQVRVAVSDRSDIGECRRSAQRLTDGFKFDEVSAGRIGIIVSELATNIVRHAGSGELLIQVLDDGVSPELEVLAIDQGPGMPDVDRCMRDGYSTGGSLGQGLGAVSRLSGVFDLHSTVGRGTVVLSRTARQQSLGIQQRIGARPALEVGAVSVAVAGEIECGDIWRIADGGSRVSMLVADGLGHGPLAATAARAAAAAFGARPFDDPCTSMQSFHRALSGTRGAAAACAQLRIDEHKVDYAGVGNIYGAVVTDERSRGMVSHNGTLGVALLRNQKFEYDWPSRSLVVMHSDGLSARWNLSDYPDIHARHPAVIAGVLYRDCVRRRDDATIVVACYRS
jgi:anti-sigma regulatory factor (Ser/Thr protein kinase)